MSIVGKDIVKEFGSPPTRVLHGIDVSIEGGEFVSISGKSGSGKSTLLYILSTLDNPSSGSVTIDGKNPARLSDSDLHHFRNEKIGFIFQFHYLLPELTALENILLGPRNLGRHQELEEKAQQLLQEFDVLSEKDKFPSQMSGGQQQRVAIARALILQPKYIFADEPTGNLDTKNGKKVMDILKKVNREQQTTVVLVTHEPDYSSMASREIFLEDGRVVSIRT